MLRFGLGLSSEVQHVGFRVTTLDLLSCISSFQPEDFSRRHKQQMAVVCACVCWNSMDNQQNTQ